MQRGERDIINVKNTVERKQNRKRSRGRNEAMEKEDVAEGHHER
jgi:hypothetical protein